MSFPYFNSYSTHKALAGSIHSNGNPDPRSQKEEWDYLTESLIAQWYALICFLSALRSLFVRVVFPIRDPRFPGFTVLYPNATRATFSKTISPSYLLFCSRPICLFWGGFYYARS
jgi:hypothetical protein